jgi:ABC-type antimicrobial peptide transport system permease subunit
MILKYVWRNFRRRKVRTVLMVLSLLVSTGLIVALNATVETIRRSNIDLVTTGTGRFDIAITKSDISPDPFIDIAPVSQALREAAPAVREVLARFQSIVEFSANGEIGTGWVVALDQEQDTIGHVEVISGTYDLAGEGIAALQATADSYGLSLGDHIEIAYNLPQPREAGRPSAAGASRRRAVRDFTVAAIVRLEGVTSSAVREGVLIDLAAVQEWLGLSGRAEQLLVVVDPALYETRDAEEAALQVRAVAESIHQALGDDYRYELDKPRALDGSAQAFIMIQALINLYGLTALGIVGLLLHTLVMTNVQEQRRDMAILRILGSQRKYLFSLVISEVAVIGAMGVGLGILLGQAINQHIIIPIIVREMETSVVLHPQVGPSAIVPAVISALVVLFLSALRPAQDAASTKVMHAINPGVADNLQIEDLAQLRERRPSSKLFIIGLVMTVVFVLIFFGFQYIFTFGGPSLQAGLIFTGFILMVLGIGLMFFITTVPFERLVLILIGLVARRLTFFARRNVSRGEMRSTLISLMVLFSGVLPSFLATQFALSMANLETDVRLSIGAPVELNVYSSVTLDYLPVSFLGEELAAIPGIGSAAGLSYSYGARATDPVAMRQARTSVVGVSGRMQDVLFQDLITFVAGGPEALDLILEDPRAVIIGEGLAEHLAIPLGGVIKLEGEGLDHVVDARVVGIVRRLPGFRGMGRSRTEAQWGNNDVLMSLDGFRELVSDPLYPPMPADSPMLIRILATVMPDADEEEINSQLHNRFGLKYAIWARLANVQIEQTRRSANQQRVFLVILTGISFTTAVFGVFAVIYVTVYARRLEIGMMKAIGMRGWELTGMLVIEAIAMTLSAALAGMAAGASMGYLFVYGDNLMAQRPTAFAVDTTVMPFVVLMVVLASIIGAAFSSRRIIRQKAVEILRML